MTPVEPARAGMAYIASRLSGLQSSVYGGRSTKSGTWWSFYEVVYMVVVLRSSVHGSRTTK